MFSISFCATDGICTYKSSPEDIEAQFGVSKRIYKQAIGDLYKRRLITITDTGIALAE